MNRRDFVKLGALSVVALAIPTWLVEASLDGETKMCNYLITHCDILQARYCIRKYCFDSGNWSETMDGFFKRQIKFKVWARTARDRYQLLNNSSYLFVNDNTPANEALYAKLKVKFL